MHKGWRGEAGGRVMQDEGGGVSGVGGEGGGGCCDMHVLYSLVVRVELLGFFLMGRDEKPSAFVIYSNRSNILSPGQITPPYI